jgi:hypothetical protein
MSARIEIIKAVKQLEVKTKRDTFSPIEIIRQVLSQSNNFRISTLRTHLTSWMCVNTVTGHGGIYPDLYKVGRGLYRLNKK